ncbi:TPA: hypothetical protein ACGN81_005743 [Bacillus cereus]
MSIQSRISNLESGGVRVRVVT